MVSSFCFYSFFSFFYFFLLFFIRFFHIIIYHFLLFFFTLCMSLFLYCTLSHLACNSWFFLSISWSARFLCVSIITSLYACHHFSEPKLYIGPYFLQVFLLLLCFSVFVFCFVIKILTVLYFSSRSLGEYSAFLSVFLPVVPSLSFFCISVLLCSASSNITCN